MSTSPFLWTADSVTAHPQVWDADERVAIVVGTHDTNVIADVWNAHIADTYELDTDEYNNGFTNPSKVADHWMTGYVQLPLPVGEDNPATVLFDEPGEGRAPIASAARIAPAVGSNATLGRILTLPFAA